MANATWSAANSGATFPSGTQPSRKTPPSTPCAWRALPGFRAPNSPPRPISSKPASRGRPIFRAHPSRGRRSSGSRNSRKAGRGRDASSPITRISPASRFTKNSSFKDSKFLSEATFKEAHFEAPVSFEGARFDAGADFLAAQSKVAFALAGAAFKNVPGFLEASFHEPPRVDHMLVADQLKRFHSWKKAGIPDPRGAFFKFWKVCGDPDGSAKFRRLKKLASEAQDQQREQEFFAQELRCRRFWHDKPFGRGMARFWLGWLYGAFANYGRSLSRPFMLWLASAFAFALFYFTQKGSEWNVHQPPSNLGGWLSSLVSDEKFPCISGTSSRIGEAFYLSFRSAFLKLDWTDSATARRVFGCLYGVESNGTPIVPLGVSAAALAQVVVSIALLFAFFLALRNLLKVR